MGRKCVSVGSPDYKTSTVCFNEPGYQGDTESTQFGSKTGKVMEPMA